MFGVVFVGVDIGSAVFVDDGGGVAAAFGVALVALGVVALVVDGGAVDAVAGVASAVFGAAACVAAVYVVASSAATLPLKKIFGCGKN